MPVTVCASRDCTIDIKDHGGPCVNPTVTYTGAVLATYERNGYDDSDFCAIVWDAAAGRIREVCYASTSSWTYHNGARVDATPDVAAVAAVWLADTLILALTASATAAANLVGMDMLVRSTTTRGSNVGVTGVVRWIGPDRYRHGGTRVGVETPGNPKLTFLDADRVALVTPRPVDDAAIRDEARRIAERARTDGSWRAATDGRAHDLTLPGPHTPTSPCGVRAGVRQNWTHGPTNGGTTNDGVCAGRPRPRRK